MKTKLKLLPLALAVSLSLTACGVEETEKVESPTTQIEKSIDYSNPIIISAEVLSDRYRANEPMSDKEFKGIIAEVAGTIESINEVDNETFITLLGHEKEKSPLVHCFFTEDIDLSKLNLGDQITIIGKITGKKKIHDDRNNVVIQESTLK